MQNTQKLLYTSTARGARDKCEVCFSVLKILQTFLKLQTLSAPQCLNSACTMNVAGQTYLDSVQDKLQLLSFHFNLFELELYFFSSKEEY